MTHLHVHPLFCCSKAVLSCLCYRWTSFICCKLQSSSNFQSQSLKNLYEIFFLAWYRKSLNTLRFSTDVGLSLILFSIKAWFIKRNSGGSSRIIMAHTSEGLLCHAHGVAGSSLAQAVLCSRIKVWVYVCEGWRFTCCDKKKAPSVLPACRCNGYSPLFSATRIRLPILFPPMKWK